MSIEALAFPPHAKPIIRTVIRTGVQRYSFDEISGIGTPDLSLLGIPGPFLLILDYYHLVLLMALLLSSIQYYEQIVVLKLIFETNRFSSNTGSEAPTISAKGFE